MTACTQVTPTSLTLRYYSHRHGLGPFLEGIVHEVARQIFGVEVDMHLLHVRVPEEGNDAGQEVNSSSSSQRGRQTMTSLILDRLRLLIVVSPFF